MARFSALNPPISGERSRAVAEMPADLELEAAARSLMRPTWMKARRGGRIAPTAIAVSSTPDDQRRGKARAHRVADVDDRMLEAG